MPDVSVIIPAYNAAATLRDCPAAAQQQRLPPGRSFELLVVDDGSTDETPALCRTMGVPVRRRPSRGGAGAARNSGAAATAGEWIAFTDSDCVPARRWLAALWEAAQRAGPETLGAAGATIGHRSQTPAARFVDLAGGLDARRHLTHPVFPFAPTGNVLLRRSAFEAVGGFDERFDSYEGADLYHRLARAHAGEVVFEPRAVVLHAHRSSWRAYWKQQSSYGRGYAQLFLRYPGELPWSWMRELAAWGRIAGLAARACAACGDRGLVGRGMLIKHVAQRIGFMRNYWSRRERRRWTDLAPRLPACVPP